MEIGATCEYNPLKKVLLFRPGREIEQLTIDTYKELSFRDVVYWRRFQQEHDQFSDLLRNEQIDVVLLNDMLRKEDKAILDPNMVYMRDTGAVVDSGYIQMRMASQVRSPEPVIVAKALESLGVKKTHVTSSPGLLEGGDLVFPDEETLMIGYGPRSNEEGAIQLVDKLLKSDLKTVVLVPLPSWRVHLDGGLMFVDKDLLLYHSMSVTSFPARVYRKNELVEITSLISFLNEHFSPEKIPITDNELYLFGANVVCLNRRKCVVYEWNERIIEELSQHGVEALPIQGSELSRGGGGPHCMTLPILRKK
ncbi:MAG: arginine deiminase family protein [Candidatus Hodarchaeales archaeon]|jgi:arginine deiminase